MGGSESTSSFYLELNWYSNCLGEHIQTMLCLHPKFKSSEWFFKSIYGLGLCPYMGQFHVHIWVSSMSIYGQVLFYVNNFTWKPLFRAISSNVLLLKRLSSFKIYTNCIVLRIRVICFAMVFVFLCLDQCFESNDNCALVRFLRVGVYFGVAINVFWALDLNTSQIYEAGDL